MYNTNSKRKSMIFWKKKFFFWNFWFFSKGGTLWCRNRRKNFFSFFKNFENNPQKWLSWDHSNINRNKVMNFGGRNSYPAATARPLLCKSNAKVHTILHRGVMKTSNPWVPVFSFAPKSRPQIAFLLWYHVFFLKSLGAKRHVLEIYRCQAPMAPMLTVPLLQFSSWTLEFQLKYMLLFCMLFNFFSRISYLSFS